MAKSTPSIRQNGARRAHPEARTASRHSVSVSTDARQQDTHTKYVKIPKGHRARAARQDMGGRARKRISHAGADLEAVPAGKCIHGEPLLGAHGCTRVENTISSQSPRRASVGGERCGRVVDGRPRPGQRGRGSEGYGATELARPGRRRVAAGGGDGHSHAAQPCCLSSTRGIAE